MKSNIIEFWNLDTWKNTNAIKAGNIVASANNNVQNKILKILKPITK